MYIEANEELIKPDNQIKQSRESYNLYEDWLKSSSVDSPERPSSIQTIIVNSVAQSYQEMFENIYLENDLPKKSSLENSNSCRINSTNPSIYSPKENTSSLIENKELSRTFYASIVEQQHESENSDEIQQYLCEKCKRFMVPIVSIKNKSFNIWTEIAALIKHFKCCANAETVNSIYEYTYFCSLCKSEVKGR